jgi:hypothetical protein
VIRLSAAVAVTALCALVIGIPSFAGSGATCTSTLAPGTYGHVTVPDGAICIIGEGPVTIRGGLDVGAGATFIFGDEGSPNVNATISGGVSAVNAGSVQIHFSTINGGISLRGGAGPLGGPFDFGDGFNPTWNTIEDSRINGSVSITGYNGFWQGFIRNTVNGSVTFNDNTVADPDGNEVVTNTIHGSISCAGNDPAPQVGDSEGEPNIVTGSGSGQCAGF